MQIQYKIRTQTWINQRSQKVQMRATKLVISIKNLTYKDRLKRLKLPTLKYRRIRGDMIEIYKILTNKYDSRVNMYLEKQQDSITRCHSQVSNSEFI